MPVKNRTSHGHWIALAAFVAVVCAANPPAHASSNLWNLYVGADLGHANLQGKDSNLLGADIGSLGRFDHNDFAYQFAAGIRFFDLFGAEVDYFNLGSGSASPSFAPIIPPTITPPGALTSAHISQKGEAAFAVLYLPVPIVDVYFKAGVARLTSDLYATGTSAGCQPNQVCPECIVNSGCGLATRVTGVLHSAETTFATGAGVQWQVGEWAFRAQYERFDALGEHPSFESIGVTRSFW